MRDQAQTATASATGVFAALLGSLCCAGPPVFAALGLGAGLAGRFEPLRPLFGLAMFAAFAVAFRLVYGAPHAASPLPDGAQATSREEGAVEPVTCAVPTHRRRDQVVLWGAAMLALALWTFPSWSNLFLGVA